MELNDQPQPAVAMGASDLAHAVQVRDVAAFRSAILSPATSEVALLGLLDLELRPNVRAALALAPSLDVEVRRRIMHESLERRRDGGLYSKDERVDFWMELDANVQALECQKDLTAEQRDTLLPARTMLERRMPRQIEDVLALEQYEQDRARWFAIFGILVCVVSVTAGAIFAFSQ